MSEAGTSMAALVRAAAHRRPEAPAVVAGDQRLTWGDLDAAVDRAAAGYARLGLPIVEVYGMTENCGVSHATIQGIQRPGTVGKPYDGVQSRLDPQTGELQVHGAR